MASIPSTIVLVTGANRGLGLGFVGVFLQRPNHTVIAAVRTLSHSQAFTSLPKHASSNIIIVHIDNTDTTSPASAIAQLSSHAISSVDIVIANAGISYVYPKITDVKLEDIRDHFEINTIGTMALFLAVYPLMERSTRPQGAIWMTISSSAASIGGMDRRPQPNAAYGPSKTALNYLTRKMHFEMESLISIAMDPGWVQTDMGNKAAAGWGVEQAETSIEESVSGMVAVLDSASKKDTSGKFLHFSGEEYPW